MNAKEFIKNTMHECYYNFYQRNKIYLKYYNNISTRDKPQ
jgi:hypothetical protein